MIRKPIHCRGWYLRYGFHVLPYVYIWWNDYEQKIDFGFLKWEYRLTWKDDYPF